MRFFCFIILLTICLKAKAQFISANAYGEALSGAMTCETGLNSIGYNPAGTSNAGYGLSISYFDRYQVKEISQKTLAAAIPALNGCFSIGFDYYGFKLFNRHTIGLGYAMSLAKQLKAGIRINYHGFNIGNSQEKYNALSGEVGLICTPAKRFELGFYLKNPSNSQINSTDSIIPVIIALGIKKTFFVNGYAIMEAQRNSLDEKTEIKIGIGGKIKKIIEVESGISTYPVRISLGISFKKENYKIQFAVSRNVHLGYMPSVTAAWDMKKEKKTK